jgi:predicted ATP-dependent protease
MVPEVAVERLRKACDPATLPCRDSSEMKPLEAIIGQERAVRSLRFGLGIRDPGFHIYVAGAPGTGRTTAVRRFLTEEARNQPVPQDLCYVHNFQDPSRPRALRLPPGRARDLQKHMKSLVEDVQAGIRKAFESEEYAAQKEESLKNLQQQREDLFARVNARALEEGFVLQATPVGLLTIPVLKGKPLNDQEFQALPPQIQEEIAARRQRLQDEIKAAMRQARGLEKAAQAQVQELDRQVALFAIGQPIEDLRERYRDLPEVISYLEEVQNDFLENLGQFRSEPEPQPSLPVPVQTPKETPFKKYEVNVLVDNGSLTGKPVVIERNPTYSQLFGRMEKEALFGTLVTDFTMIREGSLHRANGGYLVIPAEELLTNLFSWEALKRALRNREIVIEEAGERLGLILAKGIQPEPVPLDLKVILIGTPFLYNLLYSRDEDFSELFKVKADFDISMERTDATVRDYCAFAATVCEEEKLRHLDGPALAKVVEHGSRLADDQERLSTRFGEISDVIKEASYYAVQENSQRTSAIHVRRAIDERAYRSNLIAEKIRQLIVRGTLRIDVDGEAVGQVNGLSVMDLGDISFGRPNRITATVGMGQAGLIDIEREAKLGGPIHTKGVLILAGYLVERFAQDKPLTLSARLVFEQSYSGVEGDSASSTELYALLSRLSGLPIRQAIAVTGSVNQKGEIQAIGGINEKIEGYFEVCKALGLTGKQGVLVPESNLRNLMLKEEVLDAVGQGRFHVWAVRTVDEGIEVLTGVPAGARGPDGSFPEGSVNFLVDKRLRELAEAMKAFGSSKGGAREASGANDS